MSYVILFLVSVFIIIYSKKIIYKLDKIQIGSSNVRNDIILHVCFTFYIIYAINYKGINIFNIIFSTLILLALYLVSQIDREIGIIPDKYNLFILLIGILKSVVNKTPLNEILKSILPIVILFITILVIEKLTNSEAMGGGDLKLLFVLSVGIGFEYTLAILFLSNLFFILRKKTRTKKDNMIAFGPYIHSGYCTMFVIIEIYYMVTNYSLINH